jgi:lipopolysaccharide cholinephosphotransferase
MVEPTPQELAKMKELELNMLRAFVDICAKLNLRYYLLGGTLLGAVRHQGFIPWDDDIDLGMPRADYEIFLREGQKHLPEHLFLQCLATEPHYCANFAKIRDSRSTFVEYSVRRHRINHGVYIDIFPLDYYPAATLAQRKMDVDQRLLKSRFRSAFDVPEISRHSAGGELAMGLLSAAAKVRYPNLRKALDTREELHKSVQPSDLMANYCGAWGKKEIMPAQWYGEGTPVTFEGLTVMAPAQYENWLTHVYGDYMQLPPVEKRVSHHYAQFIDLEMPSSEYLKTL